ncbi:glycosyltransferase family 2 protein [Ponticoccus alexandrii]|uniref:Glycosyltransferase n=1 Tax=Ponticoccus alexandrii TaxID=1943633 RepID=A0ABX7F3U7_9RHOB|nr:glycosyltransferase family 2 protein [Ponticoccus alexandrii]ETA53709.1 glycosyl transferase [Rhodobacteraceae bacterium PD-2]QRF65008.1 glycosyltransferase [Ponticoccus alexandrii]
MTGPVSVSVVIVSRDRPAALKRCLTGIAQLDYPGFEVIVVACPAGIAVARARPDAEHLKLVPFDAPNISAARNAGLGAAAGEVVAFIDDDAVPEPLWLRHLCAPFSEDIAAAGGYVLGRNGISFQWRARSVDRLGVARDMDLPGELPQILQPTGDRAIKTEGTNMALRRAVLAALGGFDPAFHFYLDETDLNMRLARAGLTTAIVPLAQVHHGFAESNRRAPDRTPRDLFQIGASQRMFLRKHCPPSQQDEAWQAFRAAQRRRLLGYMQRGPLDPPGLLRLMHSLDRGGAEGLRRDTGPLQAVCDAQAPFLPYPSAEGAQRACFSGRPWQARTLRRRAAEAVARGQVATLFLLSPTALYHRVSLTESGVWEHRGGLFGRSLRRGPLVRLWRFRRRVTVEMERIAAVRG